MMRNKITIPTFVILLMAILLTLSGCGSEVDENLEGLWSVDGVTKYEFNEDGEGALVVPSARYEFRYAAADGELYIVFEDEDMADVPYFYEINGNILTVSNRENASVFNMTKEE